MKTANPCRKNYRPEIDPYLVLHEFIHFVRLILQTERLLLQKMRLVLQRVRLLLQ